MYSSNLWVSFSLSMLSHEAQMLIILMKVSLFYFGHFGVSPRKLLPTPRCILMCISKGLRILALRLKSLGCLNCEVWGRDSALFFSHVEVLLFRCCLWRRPWQPCWTSGGGFMAQPVWASSLFGVPAWGLATLFSNPASGSCIHGRQQLTA